MTKADIVDHIASGTGLTKVETEAVVDGFIQTVIEALKEGRNIEIRGFGSFIAKKRRAREGHQVLGVALRRGLLCRFGGFIRDALLPGGAFLTPALAPRLRVGRRHRRRLRGPRSAGAGAPSIVRRTCEKPSPAFGVRARAGMAASCYLH